MRPLLAVWTGARGLLRELFLWDVLGPWIPLLAENLPIVGAIVDEEEPIRNEIEAALPRAREVLARGLINLAEVGLYAPGP